MRVDAMEKALRQPRPFSLYLTDGRKIEVAHPEFLWLVLPHKSQLIVSHGQRGGVELLDLNQIVSIHWPSNQPA
jgi:hypothetical protein